MYFDYSATTKCSDEVIESFVLANNEFANPNSTHALGKHVKELIDNCTFNIASTLGCKPSEIIYTSGASESNNLAIIGLCNKYPNRKHIITTKIEHSSVIAPMNYLSRKGYDIDIIELNEDGSLNIEQLKELLKEDTLLVSIIMVNSEVGIINPIEEIKEILKDYPNTYFHVDATQALGKLKIDLNNIDLMSFSAHKIFGIKGVGGLIKKEKVNLYPIIYGGKSTTIYRSGTPSYPLIKSLETAILNCYKDIDDHYQYVLKLKRDLIRMLNNPKIKINSLDNCSPYILNISVITYSSKQLQHLLELKDIYVSTQTACSSEKELSDIILNMYQDEERAKSSIRISLSYVTTNDEIKALSKVLNNL